MEKKLKFDDYLEAKKFLEQKQKEHVEKHGVKEGGVEFDTNSNIALIMQEYAEEYHKNKGREMPNSILTREELKEKYQHGLTVGGLKKMLDKLELPDEAKVLVQRVEDSYYLGRDIAGFSGCKDTEDGIFPPGSKSNGWGVFLKKGDHYYTSMKMNENMREEIARRERGEEPNYPRMKDPSKHIGPEDEETLNSMKEQYTPAWCVVGYKDEEHLFIDLHY